MKKKKHKILFNTIWPYIANRLPEVLCFAKQIIFYRISLKEVTVKINVQSIKRTQ